MHIYLCVWEREYAEVAFCGPVIESLHGIPAIKYCSRDSLYVQKQMNQNDVYSELYLKSDGCDFKLISGLVCLDLMPIAVVIHCSNADSSILHAAGEKNYISSNL